MYNFYFSNNIKLRWFISIGFILHLIAAYFSLGYYSADEHYQIIGPLEKLLNIETKLTWEFDYRIRPWLQTYFYFFIIKIIDFINIDNPFILAFILRLVSSLIGFISIIFLYDHFKVKFNINNNISKILIFGFWFYAFLHARTSSENLSISMLIIGVIFFDKFISSYNNKKKLYLSILSGIFLGLSMVLKFQIVTSVFFIYLWFLVNKFSILNFKYVFSSGLIIISILFIGLIFDYFGYGNFNNTYYQYYHANFVAKWFESFGQDPWWYYFKLIILTFFPPISLIILISFGYFWFKNLNNIFTFITLPVFIFLSILSHKELRFIFPILIFSPFFVSYLLTNTGIFFAKSFIISSIIVMNLIFTVLLFVPATEEVKIYKFLYDNKNSYEKLYYYEDNPYLIDDLEPRFYTSSLPEIKKYKDLEDNKNSFIIIRDYGFYSKIVNKKNCNLVFSIYPDFINLNKNWRERKFNWYVVDCN
tara:strand:+ start:831 stop:2258 length:1428 start_codon:yes stop_codon:yes gene_type:complete